MKNEKQITLFLFLTIPIKMYTVYSIYFRPSNVKPYPQQTYLTCLSLFPLLSSIPLFKFATVSLKVDTFTCTPINQLTCF